MKTARPPPVPPAGFGPAVSAFGGRRPIHWATGAWLFCLPECVMRPGRPFRCRRGCRPSRRPDRPPPRRKGRPKSARAPPGRSGRDGCGGPGRRTAGPPRQRRPSRPRPRCHPSGNRRSRPAHRRGRCEPPRPYGRGFRAFRRDDCFRHGYMTHTGVMPRFWGLLHARHQSSVGRSVWPGDI